MRLGLASPSAPQASDRRHSPAVARRSRRKVPGVSPSRLVPTLFSNNRSSFLDLSIDTTNNTGTKRHQARVQDLQYDDSETKRSEHKNDAGPHSSAPQSPDKQEESKKPPLNFFFKIGDQSTPKKPRRDSVSSLHEVISAARTSICGQMFDRCELEFGKDRVELTIWKDNKARWQGEVKYAHMVRFCFSRVDRPPYILLLQLDSSRGRSDFATFYDPIFAKCAKKTRQRATNTKYARVIWQVYGVVFYFDEEMDYMRCQSMGDNNPRLAHLFREKLSETEVRQFSRLDVSSRLRHPRRIELKSSSSSGAGRSLVSRVGSGARQAFGSVTSFFRPTARPSVLEEDDNPSVVRDRGSSTGDPVPPDLDEEKAPISVDDAGIGEHYRGSDADSGVDRQEEKTSEKVESRKRAAASRREDEKLKRRRIESRRNEVLLTYPYDGSDTSGRISVTLGDVDRLVPGEFLNDNIIDFYLRFLWRHLPPWQQEQTYFFTSHFFTQLNGTNGAHELTTADPDERFARVARWTQKETNLFDKPISARSSDKREVVDLVDGEGEKERISAVGNMVTVQKKRLKKRKCKFTKMLRDYLECEWKARYASSAAVNVPKTEDGVDEEVPIVTLFDSESIGLLEPNIPLQSNSSDCGVFLLMYAASIVHRFPAGVTREDLENNLTSSLTPDMFRDEHVLEFREYLQQLLFSLQFLEKHGIPRKK
ncbi:Ulp1 protease family, C-terminal catalytic domain [Phytophthora cactorum]|nr:Ulp1 protease family, C-terminal catalytic domain [Phytophthora cactorum]